MGAEQSRYEGPPEMLEARDLPSLAKYMDSQKCKKVFVMLGAGVSTSAGIPDFRSPDTGLYANLARLNLPYPEAVFEINFFRKNSLPFYTLAKELLPGQFRPTLTHSFVRLLADKGLLHTCFTQNIDTLERRAGVPSQKIVEAHGSFANQRCIDCKTEFDGETMRESLKTGNIAKCPECEGLVKPDIVFFGEPLPERFHRSVPLLRTAELLFVIGTSLTVQPFASLASLVPAKCPRVLINLDLVGDFGTRSDDITLLGKCDSIVRDLCKELGWEEELESAWKETEESVKDLDEVPTVQAVAGTGAKEEDVEEKRLEDEVDHIRDELARVLGVGQTTTEAAAIESKSDSKVGSPVVTGEELPVVDERPQVLDDNEDKERQDGPPKEKL